MPFTPCHAAAVLPLLRIHVAGGVLPASALICGSMAPDVPYYVPTPSGELSTHSIGGALAIDVLLAAGLWLLWHGVLAGPALAGAPREVRARLWRMPVGLRTRVRGTPDVIALYLAFALGALTHVVWDSFTHPHRWGTDRIAILNDVYLERPVSHWLQLASTAVGALVLCGYALVRWRSLPRLTAELHPVGVVAVAGWTSVAAAAVAGGIAGAVDQLNGGTHHGLNYMLLTRAMSGAALAAVVVCAAWHAVRAAATT